VALIQNYNSILTKNENEKQFLLQFVEDYRKRFPDARKSIIISYESNLTYNKWSKSMDLFCDYNK